MREQETDVRAAPLLELRLVAHSRLPSIPTPRTNPKGSAPRH